jgi:Sap, sulfolipid-1-addressing protein
MSALAQALPLALSAAVYPPALLVLLLLLTGRHPRRLVLAYYGGAAVLTISAGLIALAALTGAGLTTQSSPTASGWIYILVGVLLLGLAAWAWRRSARDPDEAPADAGAARGRIAQWSKRATTSEKWAFALGLVMFLPSPLYLLAVKDIADSGDSSSSNVLAVLICAIGVMVFVEVPLIAMFVRPGSVAAGVERFHSWLKRNGWSLAAGPALLAGIYGIVKGINVLS